MKALAVAIAIGLVSGAAPALANIPVNDAAQLTQRSQTASTTVKLVSVTTQRQDANSGVKCAVTTGKKANVTDPTVQPQSGAGTQAIQTYAPDQPATPDPTAQGATLSRQTLFKSSGDVVAGLDASRLSLTAAQSSFQSAGQQVGTAPTVMGAIDMNSGARLQNNLAWNGAIGSANLWVTALNAFNLALTSDMSLAAAGMRASATTSHPSGPVCPVGLIGSGTANDPCRTAMSCSTTPPGSAPDPACVSARTIDTDGNVLFYLARIQDVAQGATANTPTRSASAPLTVTDVAAALAAISTNSH